MAVYNVNEALGDILRKYRQMYYQGSHQNLSGVALSPDCSSGFIQENKYERSCD